MSIIENLVAAVNELRNDMNSLRIDMESMRSKIAACGTTSAEKASATLPATQPQQVVPQKAVAAAPSAAARKSEAGK